MTEEEKPKRETETERKLRTIRLRPRYVDIPARNKPWLSDRDSGVDDRFWD